MSTTGSGRTVHWATGLLHPIQKNHGLRASLRFARRPWFQGSHRKWYNYRGQVRDIDRVSRDHIIQLEEERNKQSGEKRTSSKKRQNRLLNVAYSKIEFLHGSADIIFEKYGDYDSIFQCLSELQRNGRIRNSKPLKGLSKWYERRFGDNLGRLYYQRNPREDGSIYQVLVSQ